MGLFCRRSIGAVVVAGAMLAVCASSRADLSGFSGFAAVNARGNAASVGVSSDGAALTLTDGAQMESASDFDAAPVDVAGFTASFTYKADRFDPNSGGADGVAFVLQNDPRGAKALGFTGHDLGYSGDGAVTKSVAFELRLYPSSSVDLAVGGADASGGDTKPVDLDSGHPIRVTLDYDGATLTETLTDLTTNATFTSDDDLDLPSALGASRALIGFSGASGAVTARQVVGDFTFASKPATAKPEPPAKVQPKRHDSLASYVDPMIGTDQGGNTLPGPAAPFGMVLLSPDTSMPSVGYQYGDREIQGFSLTHMSGVGCPDEGDVFLTATTGPVKTDLSDYQSRFSHARESASAGYYSVDLRRWHVKAELTATTRAGLIRFTFPAGEPANILIPISHTLTQTEAAVVHIVSRDTIEGTVVSRSFCGANARYAVYFTMKLDRKFDSAGTWSGDDITADDEAASVRGIANKPVGAFATFKPSDKPFTVTARIGISYVDIDGARRNLEREVGSRTFDDVRAETEAQWNAELRRIEIAGGSDAERTVFYTGLYHSFLMPSVFSDVDGRYRGFDNKVHSIASGHAVYADYSGWDIYRTEAPLLTLVQPRRMADMCQSIALMYEQGGWIDRWPQANTYTNVMCGSPLTIVAADAWMAGIRGFDIASLYPGMVKDATVAPPPNEPYAGESNVRYMSTLGYIPDDKEGYGSVSQTEEDCLAYAALSSLSKSLGKDDEASFFAERSLGYRNLFDPSTKFLRPRLTDGSWYAPFDPTQEHGYVEGTGWHYRWLAMHDMPWLIAGFGGDDAFNAELDQFFGYPHPEWVGGYYNPYNEPDLEAPFLYDYSGAPWKTQARVRELEADAYNTTPAGIPGNDDCGVMSAWYVLAALGLYQADTSREAYELTSPLFPRAVIHVESPLGPKSIAIEAPGASQTVPFVQALSVGGSTWTRPWISLRDLLSARRLTYTLGAKPNETWGSAKIAGPPSLTGDTLSAAP
jgi:predicted alpha-1,2-mannosidase